MDRRQIVMLGLVLVLVFLMIAALIVIRSTSDSEEQTGAITSTATHSLGTQCLEPVVAYRKINNENCVPVYVDPDCFASGRVEIRC